ncbi:hypothetical protein [Desulfobacter vibrioformis]|uniref:hypothetical protein n=1 Tax=Desulfobacter vibrioformis TaxID=34031 RepID=UPI00055970A7|nr:hypothetical protein [Desulfobacter vibrioformis]
MYCEVYKATIPEKTCVLRQKAIAAGPTKKVRGGLESLYHRFIGCRGCAVGLALYDGYKKGEFKNVSS